jgi:hypothetical protein
MPRCHQLSHVTHPPLVWCTTRPHPAARDVGGRSRASLDSMRCEYAYRGIDEHPACPQVHRDLGRGAP